MTFDQANRHHGFVYLAREVGGAYCVKIGISKNPLQRIEPTFNPRAVEIVYLYPCYRSSETTLHAMLKSHCIRGEWFHWNDIVKEAVRREANEWARRLGVQDVRALVANARNSRPWVTSTFTHPKTRDTRPASCPYF